MKPQPITIRIEKPCHEDWDAMTPTEQGRFCGSCRKNVTDFSKMTDNEILQFLVEHTGSPRMCGQLRASQLNRVIVQTKLSGTNWKLNSFVTTLMLAAGAGVSAGQASNPPLPKQTVIINERHPTGPVCIRIPESHKQQVINAVVIDTLTGMHQPFATVMIAGSNCRTTTDKDGNFTLEIPDSLATETITLWIYVPGYRREEYTFALNRINEVSSVQVTLEEYMMKGEMIIEPPHRKCGND